MSELKAYCPYANRDGFYHKSEADKVIAEKDAKILALDAEVFKQKHHAKLFFDERNYAESQLRHSNHKRCLAMAKLCGKTVDHLNAEGYIYEKENHTEELTDCIRETEFYDKWYHRWLKLAAEPTWAKFLQLIRKEVK